MSICAWYYIAGMVVILPGLTSLRRYREMRDFDIDNLKHYPTLPVWVLGIGIGVHGLGKEKDTAQSLYLNV